MRILHFDALSLMPWKNGGGTTRELLCFPEGAGLDSFDYRISLATISADGPFSTFAGIDRTLALVEGEGVTLDVGPGQRVVVNEDTPVYQFFGETPVYAVVNAGTTMDFNVMTRRGRCRQRFRLHHGPILGFRCEADLTLVFAVHLATPLQIEGQWFGQHDSLVAGPGELIAIDADLAVWYIVEILAGDGSD